MPKLVEFKPPEAVVQQVGEQAVTGDTFDLLTTFKAKPNGDWCIVEIEGVPMDGYKPDNDEPQDKSGAFARNYQSAMQGGQMMQGGMNGTT